MLKGKKLLTVILSVLFVLSMGTLVACGGDDGACNFATEWSSDATNHWYACTDSGCKEVDQLAEHVWDNGTVKVAATCDTAGETEYKCKTCGYAKTEEVAALGHSFATTYTTDADGHWFACTRGCGAKGSYTEHVWNDGELLQEIVGTGKGEAIYACTVCGHDARNYIVNVKLVDMDGSLGGGFAEDKFVTVRVNGPKKISAVQERGPEYELVGYYTNPAYDTMVVDAEGNFVDCEYVEDGRWISEESQTLYAKWKKADKIYRVKFYVQGINNDKFLHQANETIIMKGYIGDMTAAVAPEREGFTALPFDQVLIEEGGRTSVDIYYQRNSYTVSFKDAGAESNPAPQILKYGAKIAPVANGAKDGFEFDGWYLDGEKFNISRDTVPAEDITLVAKYSIYLGNAGKYELYKGIANGKPVANGDFTINVAGLGEFESVEVRANGNNFVLVEGEDYTLENGVFTLKVDTIKNGVYGDIAIKFTTGEDFYYVNASIATKFIRTVADLENLMIYGDVDEKLNYGGYFMLANNIEVNGVLANRVRGVDFSYITYSMDINVVENPGKSWHNSFLTEGFTGVFDGQGYTIFGLEVSETEGALFGNVSKDATIKNLGIAEAKLIPSGGCYGLFGNDFAGKLDNCYIDVAIASATASGNIAVIARNTANATISNVVIKYNANNHSGNTKFAYGYMMNNWPGYATDKVVSNNVHLFLTDGVDLAGYAAKNSDGIYWADVSGITIYAYDEIVGGVSVYDSEYWNFNGDQPKFKSAGAADISRDYVGDAYQEEPFEVYADVVDGELVGNDFVIDLTDTLGDFDASAVTSVTFSAGTNKVTTTNFSLDAGILTVNGAEIGAKIYGDVVVVLNTKDVNYKISSFNIVTKYISTVEDLENIIAYGGADLSTEQKAYGGYFVMTNNIEVNGALKNRVPDVDYRHYKNAVENSLENKEGKAPNTPTSGFTGIFDGNGYSILGLHVVGGNGGIFGNVAQGATVKNLGVVATFIQSTGTASFVTGVFGNQFNGNLTNAYIEGSFEATGSVKTEFAALARTASWSTLNDVVIKVNKGNMIGGSTFRNVARQGSDTTDWTWANTRGNNIYVMIDGAALTGDNKIFGYAWNQYSWSTVSTATMYVYGTNAQVSASFADNSMWNLNGDQPKFATAGAADYTIAYIGSSYQTTPLYVYNADNSTNDFVADLTGVFNAYDIDAADVLSIDIIGERGTNVSVETSALQAGILTVAGSKFGVSIYGNVMVVLNTALVNYKISSFKVITKVLTTANDIENLQSFGGATADNFSYDGYYELGANIDVTGKALANTYKQKDNAFEWTANNFVSGFMGIFDGKGYTISGIPNFFVNNPGIFGAIEAGAIVKNTGFIGNATHYAAAAFYTAMIAMNNWGTIDNCYAEVTVIGTDSTNGSAKTSLVGRNNGVISNVVVKYNADVYANSLPITPVTGLNSATLINCYAYVKNSSGFSATAMDGLTNLAWNDKTTEIALSDTTYWNLDSDQPQFLSLGAANQEYDTGVTSFEAVSGLDGDNVVYNDLVLNYGADIDAAKVKGVAIKTASGEVAVTDYTYNAGILTISGSALAKVYGEAIVSIKTEKVNYNSNEIIIITKVIENQTDLENMPIYGGINTASDLKEYGGHFVLADNISLTGALKNRVAGTDYRNASSLTENSTNYATAGFAGIFDGKGYTISGLQVLADNGALFGNVASGAIVKNVGIIAIFKQDTGSGNIGGGVFGNQFKGSLINSYIEGSYDPNGSVKTQFSAIARTTTYGSFTDVVVKIDKSKMAAGSVQKMLSWQGSETTDWGGANAKGSNIYVFIDGAALTGDNKIFGYAWNQYSWATTNTSTMYVYGTNDSASASFADNSMWNLKGSQPMFATAGVPEVEVAYTGSTYQATPLTVYNTDNSTNNFVVDLSATIATAGIDMANVTAIELTNGKSGVGLQLTDIVDGVLTVSGETLGVKMYDKVSVVLKTAEVNYKISSFNVITKVINTKAELLALAAFGGATAAGESYDGYYVLGANIDLEGTLDTYFSAPNRTKLVPEEDKNDYKGFKGIFDGDGYTIYNMAPVYSKDSTLFGAIEAGAVVKNLGVIGWLRNYFSANATAFIAAYNGGLIENCYFEYVIENGQNYTWGSNSALVYVNDGDFKDVVIKIDATNSGASDILPIARFGYDRGTCTNVTTYINNPNSKVVKAPSSVTQKAYDNTDALTMTDGTFWSTSVPKFLSAVDPANYTR